MDTPVRSLERRYWRDADALHTLAAGFVALVGTAGLAYVACLVHAWRVARAATAQPGAIDHALVFGKRLVGGAPDADLDLRLARALALVSDGHTRSLVLLGGRGAAGEAEARVAHAVLRGRGLDEAVSVVVEDESADTIENLRQARALLGAAGRIALVSNRYHLARIGRLAGLLGMPHVLCAAEDAWSSRRVPALLLEALLLLWLEAGVRWARLIGSARLLARVS